MSTSCSRKSLAAAWGSCIGARQEKLNRLVAVKVIRSGSLAGDDFLHRFRREARAIADLDHPHIIPIYEINQEDDQPYFSMKLIESGNLTEQIPRLKDDHVAAAGLISKVALAVHHAHQRMILHRDIKPSTSSRTAHASRISPTSDWPNGSGSTAARSRR